MQKIIILTLIFISPCIQAQERFYDRRAEGWFWYEDREISKPKEELAPQAKVAPSQEPDYGTEVFKQRKNLEKLLHRAIINPSVEHLNSYILAQKKLMDQSERFSDYWQKALLIYPNLDETIKHPVNHSAKQVQAGKDKKAMQQKIVNLSKEYGLIFVFASHCDFCHQFASTVKRFADKYHWEVMAISMDGQGLKEFPNFKTDNGMVKRLGIMNLPTLLAFNPKTQAIIPIANSLVSEADLEARINLMTKQGLE